MNTRSRRWIAAALASLMLVGALVWILADGGDRPGEPPAPSMNVAQTAHDETAELTTAPRDASVREDAVRALDASASSSTSVATTAAGRIVLRGRVLLSDPDGLELPVPRGELRLGLADVHSRRSDGKPSGFTVHEQRTTAVVDGEWEVEFADRREHSELEVGQLTIGERLVVVEQPSSVVPLPDDSFLEIRARLPRPSILHVVDASTGQELDGVTLLAGWYERDELHPGLDSAAPIRRTGLRSPIDLDAVVPMERRSDTQASFVWAEGFAWTPLSIDYSHGGERSVALARGGALDVLVSGAVRARDVELRLYAAQREEPVLSQPWKNEPRVRISGLEPGPLLLKAEVGEWFLELVELGRVEVEVIAGRATTAALVLSPPATVATSDVGGTIFVASEWESDSIEVGIELLHGAVDGPERRHDARVRRVTSVRAGFDAFEWCATSVPVGRSELEVYTPPLSAVVDVTPEKRLDHVLEIAPPCELRVRVVDADTGRDVEVKSVDWHVAWPEEVDGGGLEPAQLDAAASRYVVRAPRGTIEIGVWDNVYQHKNSSIDLATGIRETTLRLERACGATIVLRDGEASVPWPDDVVEDLLRPSEGTNGRMLSMSSNNLQRRYVMSAPGVYELSLPTITGYPRPEPQTVVVKPHEFTDVVVQLGRH